MEDKWKATHAALKAKLATMTKKLETACSKDGPAHPKLTRERCSSACSSKPRAPSRAQRVVVDLSGPSVDNEGKLPCNTCRTKLFSKIILFVVVVKHFLRVEGPIVELL